ncbi:hypothetical protein OAH06_03745 [Akkermansiaceae bacterium]|nr:hypothetical protein [Akkermansiaceae bacterium]
MIITYISEKGASVYQSQVLELIKKFRSLGHEVHQFEGISMLQYLKDIFSRKSAQSPLQYTTFLKIPGYPFLERINLFFFRRSATKNVLVRSDLIIMRSEKYAGYISPEFFEKLIVDIRGVGYEELMLYYNGPLLLRWLKGWYFRTRIKKLRSAGLTYSAVSKALVDYVARVYKADRVFYIPCVASSKFTFNLEVRRNIRDRLGIKADDVLIVYSSNTLGKWQASVDHLLEGLSEKIWFLNLSRCHIDHPNVINKFVKYCEVPKYLNAGDFGVIWRNDDIVNNVACPVKYVEYVSCGLPVIHNKNVSEIKDFLGNSVFSVDIAPNGLSKLFDCRLTVEQRFNLSEMAKQRYGIDQVVERYLNRYELS